MSTRKILGFAAIAFAVALGVVVGNRMSAEAMAVVIGVVCGVAASIPMSAIILALTRRRAPEPEAPPAPRPLPPVYLMAPPAVPVARPALTWPDYAPAFAPPAIPTPREFRIIGEEPS